MKPEGPGVEDGLPIQAVSELLAIPAPTIRSWERRYRLIEAPRTNGGHRRYSTAEVEQLRRMRDEISRGRRPVEAAVLVRDGTSTAEPTRPFIDDFLRVADTVNARQLDVLLDHCRDRLGVDETVCGVVLPGMRQLGVAWQTGQCDIAQEHLITRATRGWLSKVLSLGPAPWQARPIVLSCGPTELHTLGLEAMSVLLAQRGWECHLLGERTPVSVLTAAIDRTRAAATVLVAQLPRNRGATIAALQAVDRLRTHLFYAGNAFLTPSMRKGFPGSYLGEDFRLAVETVSAAGQQPPP